MIISRVTFVTAPLLARESIVRPMKEFADDAVQAQDDLSSDASAWNTVCLQQISRG